jgi:hypothetical protein
VTEEQAKELAQTCADKYLRGFTVDKVLQSVGEGDAVRRAGTSPPSAPG